VLIDGRRYETEPLAAMTVEAWAEVLWERMVDALKVN
jgi:F420-0:gamma-glutamyl ligase-like protein